MPYIHVQEMEQGTYTEDVNRRHNSYKSILYEEFILALQASNMIYHIFSLSHLVNHIIFFLQQRVKVGSKIPIR